MTKVFLITKLKTTNIGNQALSHEIINIFKEKVGAENLIVGGRPLNLFNFSMKEIMSSKNPEGLLDMWADQVIKKYKSEKHSYKYKPEINWVSLDTLDSAVMRFEPIKKLLRPLKAKLKKYSLYNKNYEHRLNQINSSDILVYSGAGEVGVYNVFLRQMLEIRIAQKLGKKTAAVNQSVVIEDDTFKKLLLHVYGKMDKIVVRGESSKAALIKTGIDPNIFEIAPDTAIMTSSPNIRKQNKNLVGINFTPHINF
ncbi:MAG: polysaccharide pyruvyl transferase family protein, partial [Ferruginibacter sp.]